MKIEIKPEIAPVKTDSSKIAILYAKNWSVTLENALLVRMTLILVCWNVNLNVLSVMRIISVLNAT